MGRRAAAFAWRMKYRIVKNARDNTGVACEAPWEQFAYVIRAGLTETTPNDKRQLPGFVCVDVPELDDNGDPVPIRNDTCRAATALTFDLDDLTWDEVGQIFTNLESLGVEAFAYTTPSSTPESPRLRLVIQIDRPLLPLEFKPARRALIDLLGL